MQQPTSPSRVEWVPPRRTNSLRRILGNSPRYSQHSPECCRLQGTRPQLRLLGIALGVCTTEWSVDVGVAPRFLVFFVRGSTREVLKSWWLVFLPLRYHPTFLCLSRKEQCEEGLDCSPTSAGRPLAWQKGKLSYLGTEKAPSRRQGVAREVNRQQSLNRGATSGGDGEGALCCWWHGGRPVGMVVGGEGG